ncbi:MAG: TolC family protein [Flavobacteriales bacterium]
MKIKLHFLVAILILSHTGKAQQELSLAGAVQKALANNFDIKIAKENYKMAMISNTQGEAGRFPTINLTGGQNNNISDQSQNPTSFIQDLLRSNTVNAGADLNWVLFNGFRINATKHRLEQLQYQSAGNEAIVIENTIVAVILGYYNCKLQKDKLDLLRAVLNFSKERYIYNEDRQKMGISSSFDLLQFKNAVVTDSSALLMQQIAYINSVRNLNLLMAINEINTDYIFTDNISVIEEHYLYSDLREKMESNNQNLKNQYISTEIFKHDVQLAKATMYPVISFNAGASCSNAQYKIGDFPQIGGTTLNYFAGLSLNFKLYDGGKVRRALQSIKVQEELTTLNIDKLKLELNGQLTNFYELYEARLKILQLNKEALNLSKQTLDITRDRYNSGLVNSFNVREVQMTFLNSGIATLDATYNLLDTKLQLVKLTGGIVGEYQKE